MELLPPTFVKNGACTVNDFVALVQGTDVTVGSAEVWCDFDMGNTADDHLPVAVEFHLSPQQRDRVHKRRLRPYNRHAMQDPLRIDVFEKLMKLLP